MDIRENVLLQSLTTFKVGGRARAVIHVDSTAALIGAIAYSKTQALSWYVLGEGSNVLPPDEGYDGVVIRIDIPGIAFEVRGAETLVYAGAGVSWDALVREVATRGLWGFENLAGIPGTVGAAPVQNIGAYGADISQTLHTVEVYDTLKEETYTISASDCALGYRDSRFKHEPHLIITKVSFVLSSTSAPRIEYGDLLKAKEEGVDLSSPASIGDEVRLIRSKKFPDLSEFGTAGSFFKNPVITPEAYAALRDRYGEVPQFPHPHGIKIPLAFVLDKVLGMRGFRMGNAWLFGAQPLVLVLDANGTSIDIETLAREVEARVEETTGIKIEREVRTMPKK